MPEITGLLFTHPVPKDHRATYVWIKFRNDGNYVFIDFEQPFPEKINLQKLVGSGNALNCSDYNEGKELTQYNEKSKVIEILDKSLCFKGNIEETVLKIKELFEDCSKRFLYY